VASKRWCNAKTRALIRKLREREERRLRWEGKSASDVLVGFNAALEAALIYLEQMPAPQCILTPYSSYMIMTGHTRVKVGRRKHVWKKIDGV
jgi:hypothetical protein